MNRGIKAVSITAAILIGAGIILMGIGYITGGAGTLEITKEGISLSEKGTQSIDDIKDIYQFENIDVSLGEGSVEIVEGDDYSVTWQGDASQKPSIEIKDKTIYIKEKNGKKFKFNIDVFGLNFLSGDTKRKVIICYPKDETLGNLEIKCAAGNFEGQGIKAESLKIENDFGEVNLSNSEFKSLTVEANAGDIEINETKSDKNNFKVDFGNIIIDGINSSEMKIESNAGDIDVSGTLAGDTEITSDFGEVNVKTDLEKKDYTYEIKSDVGSVKIDNEKEGSSIGTEPSAENHMKINTNVGDIQVEFK